MMSCRLAEVRNDEGWRGGEEKERRGCGTLSRNGNRTRLGREAGEKSDARWRRRERMGHEDKGKEDEECEIVTDEMFPLSLFCSELLVYGNPRKGKLSNDDVSKEKTNLER